ncbi:MAG: ribonuclease J, partial [Clostridia bacterium]|nr:ribonuclease J [Clostridia bacterium]
GGDKVRICGCFDVEFIKVSHSISGAFALSIGTPVGKVFHTGDYKIDYTPIDGQVMDLTRIAEIGDGGVTLMLGESTNVEKPGTTISERKVGETLESVFITNPDERIIIATFASNVNRLQQIINICERHKRKIVFNGRSMVNISQMAMQLDILKAKPDTIIQPEEMHKHPANKICLITTGSQGEPMSALTRMASGDDKIQVGKKDIVVISSQPIPGNEKLVYTVINNLYRCGAKVLYGALSDLHVSGHACQDELKLMLALVKPKFFIPVHGEYRHLRQHEELAVKMGVKQSNIALAEIGSCYKLTKNSLKQCESIEAGNVYVDGLTDVDSEILRDRKLLSNEGMLSVLITISLAESQMSAPPEIIARGIQFDEMSIEEMKASVSELLQSKPYKSADDRANFKRKVKRTLTRYMDNKFRQKPMILPIVIEV